MNSSVFGTILFKRPFDFRFTVLILILYSSFQQKKLFHWFDKFRLNREALPVKTAKSTFVTFFVLSGAASSFICEVFSFVTVAN